MPRGKILQAPVEVKTQVGAMTGLLAATIVICSVMVMGVLSLNMAALTNSVVTTTCTESSEVKNDVVVSSIPSYSLLLSSQKISGLTQIKFFNINVKSTVMCKTLSSVNSYTDKCLIDVISSTTPNARVSTVVSSCSTKDLNCRLQEGFIVNSTSSDSRVSNWIYKCPNGCYDGACIQGSTTTPTTTPDFCGNGNCGSTENFSNCSADCSIKSGDELMLKASITNDFLQFFTPPWSNPNIFVSFQPRIDSVSNRGVLKINKISSSSDLIIRSGDLVSFILIDKNSSTSYDVVGSAQSTILELNPVGKSKLGYFPMTFIIRSNNFNNSIKLNSNFSLLINNSKSKFNSRDVGSLVISSAVNGPVSPPPYGVQIMGIKDNTTTTNYNNHSYNATDFVVCGKNGEGCRLNNEHCVDTDSYEGFPAGNSKYIKGDMKMWYDQNPGCNLANGYPCWKTTDQCYTTPTTTSSTNKMVDSCSGANCFLNEGYCVPGNAPNDVISANSISVACPQGCLKGACK